MSYFLHLKVNFDLRSINPLEHCNFFLKYSAKIHRMDVVYAQTDIFSRIFVSENFSLSFSQKSARHYIYFSAVSLGCSD
jgi:hypothetical protein